MYTHTICPWVHQYSNNWSYEHQVAEVSVPDVNPSDLPLYGLFSMAAGDFLQVYKKEGETQTDRHMHTPGLSQLF